MRAIILPGMGADSRMYSDPTYQNLPNVYFSDWPPYRGEKSIPGLAQSVIDQLKITENEIVGGSSLGGIVAAEIARKIKVQSLILIGSALSQQEIYPIWKRLSLLLTTWEVKVVQTITKKIGLSMTNEVFDMFVKADGRFIQAMCKAVNEWEGNCKPSCRVFHIHGAKDRIIRSPTHGAEILTEGGHLIAMTHSKAVAAFVKKGIEESKEAT